MTPLFLGKGKRGITYGMATEWRIQYDPLQAFDWLRLFERSFAVAPFSAPATIRSLRLKLKPHTRGTRWADWARLKEGEEDGEEGETVDGLTAVCASESEKGKEEKVQK